MHRAPQSDSHRASPPRPRDSIYNHTYQAPYKKYPFHPALAGHVAEVLVVGVTIHLRLERVERGAEGLELARLAVDLLVAWYKGPGRR